MLTNFYPYYCYCKLVAVEIISREPLNVAATIEISEPPKDNFSKQ